MFLHCRYLRAHFHLRRFLVRGRGRVFGSCSWHFRNILYMVCCGLLHTFPFLGQAAFSHWTIGQSKDFELSPPSVLTQCGSQSSAVTTSRSPHEMLSRPTQFKTATPILLLPSAHRLSATVKKGGVYEYSVFLPTVSCEISRPCRTRSVSSTILDVFEGGQFLPVSFHHLRVRWNFPWPGHHLRFQREHAYYTELMVVGLMNEHAGSCPRPIARRITGQLPDQRAQEEGLDIRVSIHRVDSTGGGVGVVAYNARWSAMFPYVAVELYVVLVRYLSYFCFYFSVSVFILHLSGVGVRWLRRSV